MESASKSFSFLTLVRISFQDLWAAVFNSSVERREVVSRTVECGRSEIDQFDVKMLVDDHVFILDVSVQDTIGVEVGNGFGNL